nr:hypothetical protein [Tanacetum cinerariifolium]
MELYMMNRQHVQMILESVENGPLIWPTIEENGVIRPKKSSDLSTTEVTQADCDVKATNIILQGIPPEVYALVSNHRITKELWERIKLLMQGTSLTKQERECKIYDEFDKFAYKKGETLHVKLARDLHTTNIDQLHAYLGQHEFHANEFQPQVSQYGSPYQSSTPFSITYQSNDYQSSNHHNVYSSPSFIPQLEYAPIVTQQQQQFEFPQLDSGLTIPVFKQGDDPIDAINHVMSFLSAIVTYRFYTMNNHLRNSSNPRQQATINDGRVTLQPVQGSSNLNSIKKTLNPNNDSWFKDKVLLIQAQANGQIINEEELAFLAYPRILEGQATQTVITHNAAYQADDLDVYDSDCDELNTAKVALMTNPSQYGPDVLVKNFVNYSDPTPYNRPTIVEVPKELSKVSMVNTSLKKLKHHLAGFDVVVKERTTATAITEALNDDLRKLKGKALVDDVVTSHTIALEMVKVDVEPIAPKFLNNRTAHSDYLRHTQEQAAILKEVVEQGKSQNPLNNSLDYACNGYLRKGQKRSQNRQNRARNERA